jgi:hypothetical protein
MAGRSIKADLGAKVPVDLFEYKGESVEGFA